MNTEIVTTQEDKFMDMMERLATAENVDVSKIEKMMDLHERILNRNAKQAYMSAFARMQPEIPTVIRTGKTNNATYAKYEDIVAAIQEVLGKYGFGFSHRVNQSDNKIEVVCVLSHNEGHSEETQFIAQADTSGSKNAVQAIGSTVSYGKRYTLSALLGLATKDDNNGDGTIDTEQAVEIDLLITETKANKAEFLKYCGVDDVRKIPLSKHNDVLTMLNKKKEKKNG